MDRCRAEIAAIEALLLAGHPDIEGLCLALSDWSAELRILEDQKQNGRRIGEPGGVWEAGAVLAVPPGVGVRAKRRFATANPLWWFCFLVVVFMT